MPGFENSQISAIWTFMKLASCSLEFAWMMQTAATIQSIMTTNHTTSLCIKNNEIHAYIHDQLLFTLMFAWHQLWSLYSNTQHGDFLSSLDTCIM